MQITKEMLEARLTQLRAGLAKAQADVNATSGAIEDCEYWLAEISREKPQDESAVLRVVGDEL